MGATRLSTRLARGLLFGAVALAARGVPAAGAIAPSSRFAVRARAFDGTTWHDSALVVVNGSRIESTSLSDAAPPAGVTLVEIPLSVLTPGLIDCDAALGLADGRDELQEASSPDLLVADAFAPDESEARAFRESGVTLAWLSTGPAGVIGGQGALVQPSAGRPVLVDRSHGACASLTAEASQPERAPTSRPEQQDLVAKLPELPGAAPARVRYDDAGSARLAAGFAWRSFVPVGLPPTPETLVELGDVPSVLSGLDASTPLDVLRLSAELAERRAFALGSGDALLGPRAVRLAGAALVQAGVPADRVLVALTSGAGRIAGDPRGVLAAGRPADLVLWSGHPLSPASRVLRAWAAGTEIYRAD